MTSCGCNFLMHIKNNQPQPAGLNKSNYYPYPELENPKNPYGIFFIVIGSAGVTVASV